MITARGAEDEIVSAIWDFLLYSRHTPLAYDAESIRPAIIEIKEGATRSPAGNSR